MTEKTGFASFASKAEKLPDSQRLKIYNVSQTQRWVDGEQAWGRAQRPGAKKIACLSLDFESSIPGLMLIRCLQLKVYATKICASM